MPFLLREKSKQANKQTNPKQQQKQHENNNKNIQDHDQAIEKRTGTALLIQRQRK